MPRLAMARSWFHAKTCSRKKGADPGSAPFLLESYPQRLSPAAEEFPIRGVGIRRSIGPARWHIRPPSRRNIGPGIGRHIAVPTGRCVGPPVHRDIRPVLRRDVGPPGGRNIGGGRRDAAPPVLRAIGPPVVLAIRPPGTWITRSRIHSWRAIVPRIRRNARRLVRKSRATRILRNVWVPRCAWVIGVSRDGGVYWIIRIAWSSRSSGGSRWGGRPGTPRSSRRVGGSWIPGRSRRIRCSWVPWSSGSVRRSWSAWHGGRGRLAGRGNGGATGGHRSSPKDLRKVGHTGQRRRYNNPCHGMGVFLHISKERFLGRSPHAARSGLSFISETRISYARATRWLGEEWSLKLLHHIIVTEPFEEFSEEVNPSHACRLHLSWSFVAECTL